MLKDDVYKLPYVNVKTIPQQMDFCHKKIDGLLILMESLPKNKEYKVLMRQLDYFSNIERTLSEFDAIMSHKNPFKINDI